MASTITEVALRTSMTTTVRPNRVSESGGDGNSSISISIEKNYHTGNPIASRYAKGEEILKYLLFTVEDVNKLY
jgi:hypothetical protein